MIHLCFSCTGDSFSLMRRNIPLPDYISDTYFGLCVISMAQNSRFEFQLSFPNFYRFTIYVRSEGVVNIKMPYN